MTRTPATDSPVPHRTGFPSQCDSLLGRTRGKGIRTKKGETGLSVFADLFIAVRKSERFYRQIKINRKVYQEVWI